MVREQGLDLLAHQVLQFRRRDNGHRRPPGHQVMGDLQQAARVEAHRQRPVGFVGEGLRGVKQVGAGVARCRGREAQDDIFRLP